MLELLKSFRVQMLEDARPPGSDDGDDAYVDRLRSQAKQVRQCVCMCGCVWLCVWLCVSARVVIPCVRWLPCR